MKIRRELLRIDEAKTILNCSRDHIYDLLSAGKLRAHNPAGVPGTRGTKILAASVERYLEEGTIDSSRWNE